MAKLISVLNEVVAWVELGQAGGGVVVLGGDVPVDKTRCPELAVFRPVTYGSDTTPWILTVYSPVA